MLEIFFKMQCIPMNAPCTRACTGLSKRASRRAQVNRKDPRGFESMQGKRKSEPRGLASVSKMAEEEGFAGRSAPSPRCAPTALAGYAGKRCRVSSAPPPHGFESTQGTYEKASRTGSLVHGGGGGIRTLVRGVPVNGFRDRRIQPLCHSSVRSENGTSPIWMRAAESSGGESGI